MKQAILIVIVLLIAVVFGWWWSGQGGVQDEMATVPEVIEEISVDASMVTYFEEVQGYYARPADDAVYPGVVMIHENRGLRPEIIAEAEALAAEGYQVLAVDLYGVVMETQDEARAFGATYDEATGLRNLQAAAAYLRAQGAPKLASLGWCFGGAQSLLLSTSGTELDATVIYYGRLSTDEAKLATIEWPVLGIFGDADQVVPVESVQTFEATLDTLMIENEIYMYEGVGHAFANPSNPNFAEVETADAWSKTLAFLERTLK
jgi:carboxymethylenebutenolidase